MRKLLIVSKYTVFGFQGGPSRQYFLAKAIAKNLKVMLVGSRSTIVDSPAFLGLKKRVVEGNLESIVLNGPLIGLGFNAKRIVSWFIFEVLLFACLPRFIRFKPDAILVSSLSVLTLFSGVLLRCILRAPLIIEVRDIYPKTLIEVGAWSPNNIFVKALAWVECFAYNRADYFVGPLENFDAHQLAVTGVKKPFKWIPMGYDQGYLNPDISFSSEMIIREIERLKQGGAFVIAHAGTLGLANDIERLFSIALKLEHEAKFHFVFIGNGPMKASLQQKYELSGNIHFFDPIPRFDVPKVIQHAHLLINPWKSLDLYKYGVSPNKWIDYGLSKRPFLTTLQVPLYVTTMAGNCFVTPDESDESLQSEIVRISRLPPEQLDEMGRKGYEFVINNLSYDKLGVDLEVVIDAAVTSYEK